MSLIPNHPLQRFFNYINDKPFWSKRWIPAEFPFGVELPPGFVMNAENSLTVPSGRDSRPKDEDPNWRKHWKCICLETTGDQVCYVIFFELSLDGRYMKKLFPLKTRYFAMRVGHRPFRLVTIDLNGETHVPEIFCLTGNIPYIEDYGAFSFFVDTILEEDVTYI